MPGLGPVAPGRGAAELASPFLVLFGQDHPQIAPRHRLLGTLAREWQGEADQCSLPESPSHRGPRRQGETPGTSKHKPADATHPGLAGSPLPSRAGGGGGRQAGLAAARARGRGAPGPTAPRPARRAPASLLFRLLQGRVAGVHHPQHGMHVDLQPGHDGRVLPQGVGPPDVEGDQLAQRSGRTAEEDRESMVVAAAGPRWAQGGLAKGSRPRRQGADLHPHSCDWGLVHRQFQAFSTRNPSKSANALGGMCAGSTPTRLRSRPQSSPGSRGFLAQRIPCSLLLAAPGTPHVPPNCRRIFKLLLLPPPSREESHFGMQQVPARLLSSTRPPPLLQGSQVQQVSRKDTRPHSPQLGIWPKERVGGDRGVRLHAAAIQQRHQNWKKEGWKPRWKADPALPQTPESLSGPATPNGQGEGA